MSERTPEDDDRTVIVGAAGAPAEAAPESDHTALPIGTKLGEFEITGMVGEGGFGIVYLAYDHSLDRKVALKEYMPSELAQRRGGSTVVVRSQRHAETFAAGLKSFINEARILAQFDHPSLVKVYRFWEANGTAYMVMPFYEGVTLKDTLRSLGAPPDEAWLKSLLGQLLDALEIIHNRQCYHRDIAPDNILILPEGTPLLLDFGAARRVIGDMTQALTVILKPGYAPIEQYAEAPNMRQGPWTDLYALASVVYYAITGNAPVPAVARIMSDPLVPLSQAAAGRYSDTFLRAIDAALAVKPEDRPQNIAELRTLLGFVERSDVTRLVPLADERRADAKVRKAEAIEAAGASKRYGLIGAIAVVVLLAAGYGLYTVFGEKHESGGVPVQQEAHAPAAPVSPEVVAAVKDKLTAFECARLSGVVAAGGAVTVRGNVSSLTDFARIDTDLRAIEGIIIVDRSQVQVVPPPHCHVVSALAPYAGNAEGPSIQLKGGATTAAEGGKVVTEVTNADFAGYVYADLYDTEGNVVHMKPNSKDTANKLDARQRVVLGEDGVFGQQWDIVPPLGKHLLVVMASPVRALAEPRPDVEKAGAYLLALREFLDRKPVADKFFVHYAVVEFVPKK